MKSSHERKRDIRASAYVRVSTLLGQDPGIQVAAIQQAAEARGFTLVSEHVDEGVSGTKESRPALDALVKAASRGAFKVIIVTALDRLARNTRHLLNLMAELDSYGVTVISLREGLDLGSPIGRAMLGLVGIVSQLERDLIADRIKTALAMKKLKAQRDGTGWRCGRKETGTPEIVAQVKALAVQGLSSRQISKRLGGRPSHTKVAEIMRAHAVKQPSPRSRAERIRKSAS
ncbi:MAG: hypothetical protein A2428_03690 [Bdellovibrionales bacterium RIFOXYC1_FULL_54_43]|nr:MAG: hypothetical protein A2428_03690 [Bdellovibrionales bacterium RIFOXYC1_FULL_54_43]OFZ83814.1 MAG: hypothetical protein A2603_11115 [Bdellovibrionales bacterium RIFOXYD1_FULL_55_31]